MFSLLKKSLAAVLPFPFILCGITFEVDSFHTILPYLTSETWLVCDLDNTLMESSRFLGSTQWGEHVIATLLREDKSLKEAMQEVRKIWIQIQPHIQVRPVQKEIPMHLETLQQQIVVMGLTARDPQEAQYTYEQLQSIQIDLSQAHPLNSHSHQLSLVQTLFDRGVLYCSHLHSKGAVFQTFLHETKIKPYPKRVVFVDDKWSHVHDVVQKLEAIGIECIGIRFSCCDARVKAFHPKIAELQLEALPNILSDEQAHDMCCN